MEEDKTALKIALGALVALAVVAALWRVLAYEPGTATPVRSVTQGAQPVSSPQARAVAPRVAVTEQDALNELLPERATSTPVPVSAAVPTQTVAPQPARKVAYPQHRASRKVAYPSSGADSRAVNTNFTQPQPPRVPYTQASASFYQNNVNNQAATRVQEERAHMLAPYLRPNRKQKEQMDAKWAKLSAAIDRAVLQALTPKSKKEQMLEKYAPKAAGSGVDSGLTGPFAPVANEIAAQKNDIVKNFGQAFGASAAREAGSLMDSFAGEIAQAASAPGATPQTTAQQVKEITKKYQEKMNKLAEKSQYDKFVADRVAQDNSQKAQLGALYNDADLQAKFNQIIDAAREKDLALAGQNLPRDEYFTQVAQNNQDMRNQLKEAIIRAGQSVSPLHALEQKRAQAQLETLKAKVESGEIESVARVASPDETRQMKKDLEVQRQDIRQKLTQGFGEQTAQAFEPILQNYETQLDQLYTQKLSPEEREMQRMALLKDVNRQLLDKQIETVEKMDIPDEQKQRALTELRAAYNNIK